MPITLNDLTVNIAHLDRAALLSDWQWLIGSDRAPVLVTAMGNAFVQDTGTGAIALLDAGTGKLTDIADSFEAFQAALSDADFVGEHFLLDDWVGLRDAGKTLAPGQVFGYATPPVLGGGFDLDNLVATDIAVHFSISGQVHRQVKDLPEGASIDGIKLA